MQAYLYSMDGIMYIRVYFGAVYAIFASQANACPLPHLQSHTQAHSQAIAQSSSCVRQEDFVTFDSEHQMLLQEVGFGQGRVWG